ncbi:hypothetical protein M3P05_10805 [Sansalvadorimonas sp. 2012CJ34-2]|uniref:Uncharacterized protein n=1 Tax=Parendozoicomonas callyspongiae TaxID=2942213 RepID=A0ABT0PG97_9GAMM|nr:hypothetical protein [Sansalvadorimonas sp. 2012CJ34-2]MCL6270409.1 hypothetical protein [Sansalvadorimonas sp. 2012CJ34-2]
MSHLHFCIFTASLLSVSLAVMLSGSAFGSGKKTAASTPPPQVFGAKGGPYRGMLPRTDGSGIKLSKGLSQSKLEQELLTPTEKKKQIRRKIHHHFQAQKKGRMRETFKNDRQVVHPLQSYLAVGTFLFTAGTKGRDKRRLKVASGGSQEDVPDVMRSPLPRLASDYLKTSRAKSDSKRKRKGITKTGVAPISIEDYSFSPTILRLPAMASLRKNGWSRDDQFMFGKTILLVNKKTPDTVLNDICEVEIDVERLSDDMRVFYWFSKAIDAFENSNSQYYEECYYQLIQMISFNLFHAEIFVDWLNALHQEGESSVSCFYDTISRLVVGFERFRLEGSDTTTLHCVAETLAQSRPEVFQVIERIGKINLRTLFPLRSKVSYTGKHHKKSMVEEQLKKSMESLALES